MRHLASTPTFAASDTTASGRFHLSDIEVAERVVGEHGTHVAADPRDSSRRVAPITSDPVSLLHPDGEHQDVHNSVAVPRRSPSVG